MEISIKNRFNNKIIFTTEAENIKEALEIAIKARANLAGAYLAGADLTGAYLAGAYLTGADLTGANLAGANLTGANLAGAYLADAYLTDAYLARANLARANLAGANLTGAYLTDAYLTGAYLTGANLTGANLTGANLAGAKGVNYFLSTPLAILLDQPQKIRAYKLVNQNDEGPVYGGIKYKIGKIYKCEANTDQNTLCSFGISLATLDWCMKEWKEDYRILVAEFTAKDIAAIPIATDGKFRVSKCKIVGEKDLKELGLVKDDLEK